MTQKGTSVASAEKFMTLPGILVLCFCQFFFASCGFTSKHACVMRFSFFTKCAYNMYVFCGIEYSNVRHFFVLKAKTHLVGIKT